MKNKMQEKFFAHDKNKRMVYQCLSSIAVMRKRFDH
jgi:hypothetical protein